MARIFYSCSRERGRGRRWGREGEGWVLLHVAGCVTGMVGSGDGWWMEISDNVCRGIEGGDRLVLLMLGSAK